MATNLGTTSPGAGAADTWKNAGSTVVLNAIAPAASAVNERYLWAGWTGTGPGNYTGTGAVPGVSIVMFGPITETAAWDLQYQVTMATNFGTTLPIAGNSWFDAGSNITLTATAPVAGPDERYVFNGWNGTGIGAYSGMDNPAINAVAVGGPITETASWNLQRLPGAPVNLSAQIGDGMVSLTWEAPNGGGLAIDHYVVYQDGVEVKTVLTLYATITGLANGQAYSFTVAAHNAIGNGSSPTAVVVTPMLGASSLSLEIISPLSGAFTRNGSAMLVWNAVGLEFHHRQDRGEQRGVAMVHGHRDELPDERAQGRAAHPLRPGHRRQEQRRHQIGPDSGGFDPPDGDHLVTVVPISQQPHGDVQLDDHR